MRQTSRPLRIVQELDPSASDRFFTLRYAVPQLPAGNYTLRITFRDGFTGAEVGDTRRITILSLVAPTPGT